MITYGESVRFTSREIEQFRQIGIDLTDARNQKSVEQALDIWAQMLARERPNLLRKILRAMIEAKRLRTGGD